MDTLLGQLSELRKLWDSIGYLKDGNNFQSISEWQTTKLQVYITLSIPPFLDSFFLKPAIQLLHDLISAEESVRQELKHSIANFKVNLLTKILSIIFFAECSSLRLKGFLKI